MNRATRVTACVWMSVCLALAAACGGDPSERAIQYIASGDRYAAKGQLKEAAIEYGNAVKADPARAEAHRKLGEVSLRLGRVPEGYRALSRAADVDPRDAATQLQVASLLIAGGDFDGAKNRAELALAAEPKNADAHVVLATALAGLNRVDEAIAEIERGIRVDPSHAASFAALGSLRLAEGKRAEAERLLLRAVALEPDSARPRLALANFHWAMGDAARAEAAIMEALAREPESRLAHRAAAILYLTTGRAGRARSHLETLAAGGGPFDRIALADFRAGQGDTDAALRELEPLTKSRDKEVEAAARAVTARLLLGRTPPDVAGAVEQAKAAVGARPDAADAQYALGLAQAASRRFDEADRSFAEALRLNPRATAAALQRSRLRLARGDARGALEDAATAARGAPGRLDTSLQLVRSLRAAGQIDRARGELTAVVARHGDSPAVRAEAGWIALAAGDRRAARDGFERSGTLEGLIAVDLAERQFGAARDRLREPLAARPNDTALLTLAARVELAAAAPDAAEPYLARVLELDSKALEAYLLLADLHRRRGDVDQARAQYERAAAVRPDAAPAADTVIGMLDESAGKTADAARRYERALARDPRAAVAANNLAWIYAEQGRLDAALPLAEMAVRELPGRAEPQHTLGWIYLRKRLPLHAIPALERSVERAPARATYRYHLGLAHMEAGERRRAEDELRKAVELDPKLADARAALEKLNRNPKPAR